VSALPLPAVHKYPPPGATAVLVFSNGQCIWGQGFGAQGVRVGELCFNTAITGYQEIMTDPSYAGQLINFTFPHIGNVGANGEDLEATIPHALGCVVRELVSRPSNFRAQGGFDAWLQQRGLVGMAGVDTRALTQLIRAQGAPTAVLVHDAQGQFDLPALIEAARAWPGLSGMDLACTVWQHEHQGWQQGLWRLGDGYPTQKAADKHVVALDYGMKHNILRHLVAVGLRVSVVPGNTSWQEILALSPDGIFLSNGPGDPAATGDYAIPTLQALLQQDLPIFGICLGHQMLALALGAKTYKMHQGHRGANHPVQDLDTGKVEITAMNHGFAVDTASLPDNVRATHISLFDRSLCGLSANNGRVFSVQHHPEASPGPQDSAYLFKKFRALMEA
jgi:carbamoyl-phosphate synthase small subunit